MTVAVSSLLEVAMGGFTSLYGDCDDRRWLLSCLMAVPLLLLHGGSYFWGEGNVFRTCRRLLALRPSYMFKCGGLNHWIIQSLGLCLFIIGPYPSPRTNLHP
ncbi:hypothetical protein QL285_022312 [Trifolium repens]|nr:hypothetical protein QL285_022312 [Trifolium repens]